MQKLKNLKIDFWAILIIVAVTIVFFTKLFYPQLSFFVTPDFGASDIWQLNLPAKFFLSQSLKANQLPLWSNLIGNGFPVLAEGQIGALNLFNLILFKFLSFAFAYNLSYIFIFSFTAIGAYLYLRTIGINRFISLFSSLSFSFSAFFVCHIPHFNLIQTASFLPWLFLFTERIIKKNQLRDYLLLAIFLCQQLFSGFPQITFITLLGISSYYVLSVIARRETTKQSQRLPRSLRSLAMTEFPGFIKFSFFIFLGFSLSAIQLLPQLEFLKLTNRANGLDLATTLYYSFPLKHLLTFLNPIIFGTPQLGTYPAFDRLNGSIFWENSGFLGLLPILILPLIFLIKKNSYLKISLLMLVVSFLMMLGKFSPAYVAYLFPPFSFFRVPSRFILLFIWAITILSAIILHHLFLKKKLVKILIIVLCLASLIHLFSFSFNYNPILPANQILKQPATAQFLKSLSIKEQGRAIVLNEGKAWNDIFTTVGWKDPSVYLFFRNNLKANFNLIYNLSSADVYPIMLTNRYTALMNDLYAKIETTEESTKIDSIASRLLSLMSIRYIISPYPLDFSTLKQVFQTQQNSLFYRIYENLSVLPRAYFVNQTVKAETMADFEKFVNDENFDFKKTAVVEDDIEIASVAALPRNDVAWQKDTNTEIIIYVSVSEKGLLVLADSYYPGWKAFVDNQEKPILPVNINSRGIVVDRGEHIIKFLYQPESLKKGILVSLVSFIVLGLLAGFGFVKFFAHKFS